MLCKHAVMGRALAQLCGTGTLLAVLLLLFAGAGATDATRRAAATNNALTFHLSFTSCLARAVRSSDEPSPTQPQRASVPPHCTLSVRILRRSPRPLWHAVHNQSVTPALSPYFTYHIPSGQQRCHHHVVLRCVSSESSDGLLVIPAAGFFRAPLTGQQPMDTFVIFDNASCSMPAPAAASSVLRMDGFCLTSDALLLSYDASVAPQQPTRNFSHSAACPAQPALQQPSSLRKRSSPRALDSRLSARGGRETSHAPSLSRRFLVWLYQQSRSGRPELATRQHWQQAHGGRLASELDELTMPALQSLRSWLFVLSGASVCSAAVLVCFIVRLTRQIERY